MKKNIKNVFKSLHQRAEQILEEHPVIHTEATATEAGMRKLVHELEVHQIELEMMNEELAESHKRAAELATNKYAELYDFAPSGYFTLSTLGDIIELNLSGATILGKERLNLINNHFGHFVSEDTKPIFNSFIQQIFTTKTKQSCKITISTKDNIVVYVHLTGIANPNAEQCLVTMVDIREYWLEHEKQKRNEEKYRLMFENNPQPMWIFDLETLEILEVNNSSIKQYGYSREEFLNMTIKDIRPTEDILDLTETIKSEDITTNSTRVWRHIWKNGELRYVEITAQSVDYNGRKARQVLINDVTEIKKAEAALKQNEEKFRTILESQHEGIGFVDENEVFGFVNPEACRIFGCENLVGTSLLDFLTPSEIQRIKKQTQHRRDGISNYYELQITTPTGNVKYLNISSEPKHNIAGDYEGAYAVFSDITERKLAQEALIESEERYRKDLLLLTSIFESPVNIIVFSLDNNYCYNSFTKYHAQTMKMLWGVDIEMGMNMLDVISDPDDKLKAKINFDKTLSGNYFVLTEEYGDDALHRTYYENFYSPVKNTSGEIIGISVFVIDATERMLTTKRLEISEKRFRQVVEQTADLIAIINTEGVVNYTSSSSIPMFQLSPEDMVGCNFIQFVAESDVAQSQNTFQSILESGAVTKDSVFKLKRNDGSEFFGELNGSKFQTASLNGVLVTIRDISERITAEIELKKLSQAVEQSPVMTVITNLAGNIEYLNPVFTKITGYSRADLYGKNPSILSSREKSKEEYQELWKTISSGNEWQGEFHNVKKNGESYWAGALISAIFDANGIITHYVSVEEDITQRKEIEKQLIDLNASLEQKVEERTLQLNEAKKQLEHDIQARILIENDLRWNKSLLELMSNSSPLAFLVVDNRTDAILYFNHRFCKIWGIEQYEEQMQRGELKNNDIIPFCLPVLADIPAFAESCKPLQSEDNRIVVEDEIAFTENRTVRRFTTQIRGENDEYYGRFYIFEDITARKQVEAALLESEQMFSSFMDYLPAVVFLKDHEGKTLFVNKYMDIAFGASSWIGKTMLDVFPDELGEKFIVDDINSIQMGYQKIEERLYQLDGKLHDYETQKFVIQRPNKDPFLGGISLDITERKRAELLVAQTKQNYETFFNTIDDFLFVLDELGNIIHVNDTVLNRLEYSKEELVEMSVLMVHPRERREEAGRIVGEMLQGISEFCPVPLITKSGKHIPVETRVKTGFWNSKPVIFGVSKDMSKIQLSEEKFSKAFHFNSAAMAISSPEHGIFIDVNDAFVTAIGYSRDELIGTSSVEIHLFEDESVRANIYADLQQNIKVRDLEIVLNKKTGEKVIGLFSAEQIYVGDMLCLLTLFVDITERKKAEQESRTARLEAEKANMAKSEFLSRMSHELRTPMNSILGFAQILEMGELNPIQKKGVNHIMRSGKHLLGLINEVLDISRIEAGRLSISIEPTKIRPILLEMMDVIRPLVTEHQIVLQLTDVVENDLFVKSDRQSLKQVLLNLLNNAVKYNNPNGSVTVITQLISHADVDFVRISITDTGVGISDADIPKLFTPFERIGAYKTQIEGTGLGLAVVKKLIEAMDGTLGVTSILGEGSTFWIELPLAESQLETLQNTESLSAITTDLTANQGTILYIEDNMSNIELVEQILSYQRPGIRLVSNMNGKQAVKQAIDCKPDLILLDLNLPDIQGDEVLKNLLKNDNTKHIPVVIISADALQIHVENLLKAGAKTYLTKPLDVSQFLVVIDEYMQKIDQ